MAKKLLMALAAVLVVVGGVAALSAYEAHVINVTAHIENALYVHDDKLSFGTVFPQEYLTRNFTVNLSDSFVSSGREDLVSYKIVQKTKCINEKGEYAQVNYWNDECPEGFRPMLSLCPFLSKLPKDTETGDNGVPSYFHNDTAGNFCETPKPEVATGIVGGDDYADEWIVDLKVPPVAGYIGQDWPASCANWTVAQDGQNYGCDLWVEVTNIALD